MPADTIQRVSAARIIVLTGAIAGAIAGNVTPSMAGR